MKLYSGWFILLLFVALLLSPSAVGAAAQPIQLFLNGKPLVAEVPPRIMKDNTIVPVRIIAEELGAKVQWDGNNQKVTVDKEQTNIQLRIDQTEALVNNSKIALEIAPVIIDGNTMLPLRFISETLGIKVTWDELTKSVFLFQKSPLAGDDNKSQSSPVAAGSIGPQPADRKPAESKTAEPKAADSKTPDASAPDKQSGSGSAGTQGNAADGPAKGIGSDAKGGAAGATKPAADNKQPITVLGITFAGEQITVKTNGGTVKPNMMKLKDPDRIVVDLPNAMLDSSIKLNESKQAELAVQHPSIQKIRFSLFSSEPSIVRMVIDLKSRIDVKMVDSKQPNQLVFETRTSKPKVVIDAGHGDGDSGAISATGRKEKDFTLSMATQVAKLLEKEPGIEVVMTRKDDTFLELAERVAVANEAGADLFLSIHGNKFSNATIRGVETYYSRKESLSFANTIHRQALAGSGFKDRSVRQSDFYVIKHTTMPAVLLEVGYLSNKEEEALMYQDAFQSKLAASIVAAILETLNSN